MRSQSAAPEVFSGASFGGGHGGSSRLPYGHISSTNRFGASGSIQDENDIFSRSRFFDEEEEDREALMQAAARRPASTGVIVRPSNDNSDVNSILQTLGLAPSSQDYNSENHDPHVSSQFSSEPMGGIASSNSFINGPPTQGKKSIMEKIHGGTSNSMQAHHFKNDETDFFSNQGGISYQSGPQMGFQNESHRSLGHNGSGQYTSSEVRFRLI